MAKTEKTAVPKGMESVSSSLPPFFSLMVAVSALHGVLQKFRQREKPVGKGKKKHVEITNYYEFLLLADATGDDGTKKHNKVSFKKGDMVTLSGSGVIDRTLTRLALQANGVPQSVIDGDEDNYPEINWDRLVGVDFFIRRLEDGVISKGEWKGNKVKQYDICVDKKSIAGLAKEAVAA